MKKRLGVPNAGEEDEDEAICEAGECENERIPGDALCLECAVVRDDAYATRPRYVTDYETDMREAGRGHLL